MARATVNLTDSFQQLAAGRCVITIIRTGRYIFNDVSSDTAAMRAYFKAGEQVVQTERVTTHGRALDDGAVIVDTEA